MTSASGNSPNLLITVLVIIAWYACNIGVILLNKFLLSTSFKKPVFLTLMHMSTCLLIGSLISASNLIPIKPLKSKQQAIKISVLSFIFCFTIVAANASLRWLPVSFNQAIGATTPFFTAIFAFLFQGIIETGMTYCTLIPIAGGIAIASSGEPLFNLIGFLLCISATAARALKSVVQSILLTDHTEKMDAMSLLLYMSGFSIVLLVPAAYALEPESFSLVLELVKADRMFLYSLLLNSLLAYFTNLTNFLVTKYTSALTLQVLGNAKGVIAAVVSVWVFRNPVTYLGVIGYAVTVIGVFLYSESKRKGKLKAVASGTDVTALEIASPRKINPNIA